MSAATVRVSKSEAMNKFKSGEITMEEALAIINGPGAKIYFKISKKGGISCYGLQRMPVTLYLQQWQRFFEFCGSSLPAAIKALIGTTERHEISKYTGDADEKFLAAVKRGEKRHAKVDGAFVIVGISEKDED